MRRTRSLLGIGVMLALAWSLAWSAEQQPDSTSVTPPMLGDYIIKSIDVTGPRRLWAYPLLLGAYKIAENESPRPQDRLFVTYNGFFDVVGSLRNGHRQTIGLEKTLFGSDASIGLRLPFYEEQVKPGEPPNEDEAVGDLSIILKYAPIHNRDTGNILSTGLVITPPTGPNPHLRIRSDGSTQRVHPTLLQPFVGYIWMRGDFFLQAFHSVMITTDSRTWNILFNDIGVGYWVYRAEDKRFLTGIIPTFEVHVNTPLNHRGSDDRARINDLVDLTFGTHFEFYKRVSLGIGVVTPVTAPRLFQVEAIANFNWRF